MNVCIVHIVGLVAAILTCQGGGIGRGVETRPAVEWHGRARSLDVHANGGVVTVRPARHDEIEVSARLRDGDMARTSAIELRVLRSGQDVVVSIFPEHLASMTDLDVRIPKDVSLRASNTTGRLVIR